MTQLALIPEQDSEHVVRTLVLPFTPISKNQWDGWQPMWKAGLTKRWEKRLLEGFEEQQFPKDALKVVCSATIVFASNRRRDFQNYMHPLWYWVADALVDYGAIRDDTPEYFSITRNGGIEFKVDRREFVSAKQKQRTVLGFAFELPDG